MTLLLSNFYSTVLTVLNLRLCIALILANSRVIISGFFVGLLLATLSACSIFSNGIDEKQQSKALETEKALTQQEISRRETLVAGKSARPSLKSLNLQPVVLSDTPIPELSLAQKKAEYEALLPMLKDSAQKQQVAFRLADIKMVLAEQTQHQSLQQTKQAQPKQISIEDTNAAYANAIEDYRGILNDFTIVVPAQGVLLSEEQQALNRKQMDAMYQLTRALDVSAKPDESVTVAQDFLRTFNTQDFGITPYHLELYFRIGEYYFNRQQYGSAVDYYEQVVDYGSAGATYQTNFYGISAYMLGWSYFKLDDYEHAMQAFAAMLDAKLPATTSAEIVALEKLPIDKLNMGKGELRLVKDSVRVMALTFSYQGNGAAIAKFFTQYGQRNYEHLIYEELAQQYLDNDRYLDSAKVLLAFAKVYPLHPRAVEFYIRHIDAYVLGGYANKVLLAKEAFVQSYSLGNGLVGSLNTPIGRDAEPYLRQYISQLAQTEHSIGQGIDRVLAARKQSKGNTSKTIALNASANKGNAFTANQVSQKQSQLWAKASNQDLTELSKQAYSKAKAHYKNYIKTFSPSPEIPSKRFYLAEALLALNEFDASITAFETFAYIDQHDKQNALAIKPAEGAYAALLVYEKIAALHPNAFKLPTSNASLLFHLPLNRRQASQAKFAEQFAKDARAPSVALNLMQDLFKQQNYLPAQQWAEYLLSRVSANTAQSKLNISEQMQDSAMLVMAHSYFAMEEFAEAEIAYRAWLARFSASQANAKNIATNDPRTKEITNRLAASLYKQAEKLLARNQLDTASMQRIGISNKSQLSTAQLRSLNQGLVLLQKVVNETPLSEFRLAAQYDSAAYFALLEKWPEAIATFSDFKQRFASHPLSQGIDDQLFYAYEQTQDWSKAAELLLRKYKASEEAGDNSGRMALYQAATYFEKAGERAKALDSFRTYAHKYALPLSEANEARFTLSEYYLESGADSKRRFWLNKLIQSQESIMSTNPQLSTARSVYLASMAAMVFANDADAAYSRIKLVQPLMQSLQKKQTALSEAINAYDRVISFGSADYVTAANYKLANLYTVLAIDLMDSDRPAGMSDLELSQYEILLEEQAYPFEETAIDLHVKNSARVETGLYDKWVKESFNALKGMLPARYNKPEAIAEVNIDDL